MESTKGRVSDLGPSDAEAGTHCPSEKAPARLVHSAFERALEQQLQTNIQFEAESRPAMNGKGQRESLQIMQMGALKNQYY